MKKIERPLLINGEAYNLRITKAPLQFPTVDYKDYNAASKQVIASIDRSICEIKKIPDDYRTSEIVLEVKMQPGHSSKSDNLNIFAKKAGFKIVGSKLNAEKSSKKKEQFKSIFINTSEEKLSELKFYLNEHNIANNFKNDVMSINVISLPDNKERLQKRISALDAAFISSEIILYSAENLEEIKVKFEGLCEKLNIQKSSIRYSSEANGLLYIFLNSTVPQLQKLVQFNHIRTINIIKKSLVLPELHDIKERTIPSYSNPTNSMINIVNIGMFDGGINPMNKLKDFALEYDPFQTIPKDISKDDAIRHGTGVASSIIYGDLADNEKHIPANLFVHSYRLGLSENYRETINFIKQVVENSPIKLYNLSMNLELECLDEEINYATSTLDKLSYKFKCIFVVSTGNNGRRLEIPADLVNGMGVGAYTFDINEKKTRAGFSNIGPGRSGLNIKPDLVAFGGGDATNYNKISVFNYDGATVRQTSGTSYAAPIVTRRAGELLNILGPGKSLAVKALLIHSACNPNAKVNNEIGHGFLSEEINEILGCTEKKITTLYISKIIPNKFVKVTIPFIEKVNNYNGKVKITWTISVFSPVDESTPSEYTLQSIEDVFYPHSKTFTLQRINPENSKRKTAKVHIDSDKAKTLISEGFKQPANPTSKSSDYVHETEKLDPKWDTTVKKSVTCSYKNVHEPFLILHGISRGESPDNNAHIEYALIVTVEYLDVEIIHNFYEETCKQYTKLEQIELQNTIETKVKL